MPNTMPEMPRSRTSHQHLARACRVGRRARGGVDDCAMVLMGSLRCRTGGRCGQPAPPALLKAHPDQIESMLEETEPGCALDSTRLSHFLRRTGVQPGSSPGQAFGGKCFSFIA